MKVDNFRNESADPPLWGVTRLRGGSSILYPTLHPVCSIIYSPCSIVHALWQYWMLDGAARTTVNYHGMAIYSQPGALRPGFLFCLVFKLILFILKPTMIPEMSPHMKN